MNEPIHRGRRLRRTAGLRALARETRIAPDQLVAPLFVHEDPRARQPIPSLPGHARLTPEAAAEESSALLALLRESLDFDSLHDLADGQRDGRSRL